ncbi:MAG: hypothetical protein Q9183_002086 [Haloplaca sp. 2 TL-2023]
MLWLALHQAQKLVELIGESLHGHEKSNEDLNRVQWLLAQQSLQSFLRTLPLQELRSKILETFIVPTSIYQPASFDVKVQARSAGAPSKLSTLGNQRSMEDIPEFSQDVIAMQRTVDCYGFNIRSTDIITIELAVTKTFFGEAHHRSYIAYPGNMREALSDSPIVAEEAENALPKRKLVEMPPHVSTSVKISREILETDAFLPDWMYFEDEQFHKNELNLDVDAEIRRFEGSKGLETTITRWRTQRAFSNFDIDAIPYFFPHVADSGVKATFITADVMPMYRHIEIDCCKGARWLYKRLAGPRDGLMAKKRLVEVASHNQELALICWLTTTPLERPFFHEFLNRHGSSESVFGECVDWKGNIWDTEFHLGFYQLLTEEENKHFPPHSAFPSQHRRTRRMPNLSGQSDRREITLVASSLRFVGDLRDRSWTCYYLSSIAREGGFTSLSNEHTGSGQSKQEYYTEVIGQRKVLEMVYVERILLEVGQSNDAIISAFSRELDVPEARDPQNESYEFMYRNSRLHSKAGEILREVSQQIGLAIKAVEEWERREETRPTRSRWSYKDEKRCGQKLMDLTRRCKLGIQNLRIQKDRLVEQQRAAEQHHNHLISYMQLQDARASSRSAEDVRLFTYVTIVFLPLSFSSSLFSMQGAPGSTTLSAMLPTTVVALALTFFALSNMKVMDRHWTFWTYTVTANARKKMQVSEHAGRLPWPEISRELEETAQLRLAKVADDQHLPAGSKWWYALFWLSQASHWCVYILRLPSHILLSKKIRERRSERHSIAVSWLITKLLFIVLLPICAVTFASQWLLLTAVDILRLIWQESTALGKTIFNLWHRHVPRKELLAIEESEEQPGPGHQADYSFKGSVLHSLIHTNDESQAADSGDRLHYVLNVVSGWLRSPPRPIRAYAQGRVRDTLSVDALANHGRRMDLTQAMAMEDMRIDDEDGSIATNAAVNGDSELLNGTKESERRPNYPEMGLWAGTYARRAQANNGAETLDV